MTTRLGKGVYRIENRGTVDVPFGFVYNDRIRIGFDSGTIWHATGWGLARPSELQRAWEELVAAGVKGYDGVHPKVTN